jgi:hypothetical protein
LFGPPGWFSGGRGAVVNKSFCICCLAVAVCWGLCSSAGFAATDSVKDAGAAAYFDTLTLYWENDFFAGTDRDYTNGIKLSWSTPFGDLEKTSLPAWSFPFFERLPLVNKPGGSRAVSLAFGQDMYTPVETSRSDLIEDDRPYAGYSYIAAGFHTKRAQHKDSWELRLGVVGPASLAEATQNTIHDAIGDTRAKGWDHQLKNEVTFDVTCERQWRQLSEKLGDTLNFDLIPHVGGSLGTTKTHVNTGAEIRFGRKLPNDFGSCPIRGGCETNSAFYDNDHSPAATIHFFLSGDARLVLRDIFLDGNTYARSHQVDKKTLVGELMGGIVWQKGRFKASYAYIYRTREFDTQRDNLVYGSLSLAWTY